MRKILVGLMLILICQSVFGQMKVGRNPTNINSNSQFEVESNSGSQFVVSRDSAKVGIGTVSPNAKLDVIGTIKVTDGTQGVGKVLTSDANGLASWQNIATSSNSSKDSTTASNGITLSGKDVQLGGTLSKATTITTTATNTIALDGLQSGSITDSILVANPSSGVIKRVSPSSLGILPEPWNNVATNSGASSNTQDIYQMGKVGVNTNLPGSSLAVNGSLGTNYNVVTSASYSILNSDYYINYEGTTTSTLNLPIGVSGTCNCEGRTYVITNASNYSIVLKPTAGEMISGADSLIIDQKQSVMIVNTNSASGSTWRIITFGTIKKPINTYLNYSTDVAGYINDPIAIPVSTNYTSLTKNATSSADITLVVPSDYSINRTIVYWNIWGDLGTASVASGSVRFIVEAVYTNTSGAVTNYNFGSVMMTGWSTHTNTVMRYSAPVSIVLSNLAAGTYVFKVSCRRESELGGISYFQNYGVSAKGEVLVK